MKRELGVSKNERKRMGSNKKYIQTPKFKIYTLT
jgi:hypothetical protein